VVHVEDDGSPIVWRASLPLRASAVLGTVLVIAVAVILMIAYPAPLTFLLVFDAGMLGLAYWLYSSVVAQEIRIDDHDISISALVKSNRMPLSLVESARSGSFGITVTAVDGHTISSSFGRVTNNATGHHRVTRADRIAAVVNHRAALARGEDPGPIVLEA